MACFNYPVKGNAVVCHKKDFKCTVKVAEKKYPISGGKKRQIEGGLRGFFCVLKPKQHKAHSYSSLKYWSFFFAMSNTYRNIAINMGATKTQDFKTTDNKLAKYAKALAHPARIAILQFLCRQQSCMCGDIVEVLPLSQSTVSQHLKELKAARLIKGEIEGARVCYCIDEKEWKAAQAWLNQLFDSYDKAANCC